MLKELDIFYIIMYIMMRKKSHLIQNKYKQLILEKYLLMKKRKKLLLLKIMGTLILIFQLKKQYI